MADVASHGKFQLAGGLGVGTKVRLADGRKVGATSPRVWWAVGGARVGQLCCNTRG